ncbi:hypothetical protein NPIL_519831 [Nephila pilipes]|uniref:Uncharacterized protein n=1 Tax=Nephila pilipes TaxID=299642 RepID=A0A8X6NNG7_NEPPI|nr:hypothetical protein NPIL_519831 [Nephila pilipes]
MIKDMKSEMKAGQELLVKKKEFGGEKMKPTQAELDKDSNISRNVRNFLKLVQLELHQRENDLHLVP